MLRVIIYKIISIGILIFLVGLAINRANNYDTKSAILITTLIVIFICAALCFKEIRQYFNGEDMESFANNWQCYPQNSSLRTPVRINSNGDVECLSKDTDKCMWVDDAQCNTIASNPPPNSSALACGDMLMARTGTSGYDQEGHWCKDAKISLKDSDVIYEPIYYNANPTFGQINDFPDLSKLKNWKLIVKFSLNLGSENRSQAIVGCMNNNKVQRGWGVWVNPSRYMQWSWSNDLIDLTQLGKIEDGLDYTFSVIFTKNVYTFALKAIEFRPVLSSGSFGLYDLREKKTNTMFKQSNIFRRECVDCDSAYKDMYYYRTTPIPEDFSIYKMMKETWGSKNNELNKDFLLFNKYQDLIKTKNKWLFCNYDDPGLAFPRDCGITGMGVPWQWNSPYYGGQENYRYSIPVEVIRSQDSKSGTINTNGAPVTVGGKWENNSTGEIFQGRIYDLQLIEIVANDFEEPPQPPCGSGWWQQGDKCLQICPNSSQSRNEKGYCLCNKGGPDQSCATDYGFRCLANLCRRTYDEASKNQAKCN